MQMLASSVQPENRLKYGTWRSLVARFLGVEEAVSSNLAVPIETKAQSTLKLTELSSFRAAGTYLDSGQAVYLVSLVRNLFSGSENGFEILVLTRFTRETRNRIF
jgi:hypothetical protein